MCATINAFVMYLRIRRAMVLINNLHLLHTCVGFVIKLGACRPQAGACLVS